MAPTWLGTRYKNIYTPMSSHCSIFYSSKPWGNPEYLIVAKSLSRVQLFATPWTIAHQAPPSMGSSRQDSWSGLPFPSPGDLPDPGIEPRSPAL